MKPYKICWVFCNLSKKHFRETISKQNPLKNLLTVIITKKQKKRDLYSADFWKKTNGYTIIIFCLFLSELCLCLFKLHLTGSIAPPSNSMSLLQSFIGVTCNITCHSQSWSCLQIQQRQTHGHGRNSLCNVFQMHIIR